MSPPGRDVANTSRDPAQAIARPCWSVPDTATAELTLAEILTERREARVASEAWLYERDVVQRRRDDIGVLRSVTNLPRWQTGSAATEPPKSSTCSSAPNPTAFLDTEPDLAAQVVDWFNRRRRLDRFPSP